MASRRRRRRYEVRDVRARAGFYKVQAKESDRSMTRDLRAIQEEDKGTKAYRELEERIEKAGVELDILTEEAAFWQLHGRKLGRKHPDTVVDWRAIAAQHNKVMAEAMRGQMERGREAFQEYQQRRKIADVILLDLRHWAGSKGLNLGRWDAISAYTDSAGIRRRLGIRRPSKRMVEDGYKAPWMGPGMGEFDAEAFLKGNAAPVASQMGYPIDPNWSASESGESDELLMEILAPTLEPRRTMADFADSPTEDEAMEMEAIETEYDRLMKGATPDEGE